MRKVYCGLAGLMLLAVFFQFYFAATGAFTKPASDNAFALHSIDGMIVIPTLSVLATIVAAVAKVPGRLIGLTILPLGLVVVQMLIIGIGSALSNGDAGDATTPGALIVYGLHGVNGLAIMAVTGTVFARSMALIGRGRAARRAARQAGLDAPAGAQAPAV